LLKVIIPLIFEHINIFSIDKVLLQSLIKALIFVIIMKFYEKYPQLKEKGFLAQILTDTVFSTMSLEKQQVPMLKVQEIVQTLLKEQELKGDQFFSN
jgi:hypothetical protein